MLILVVSGHGGIDEYTGNFFVEFSDGRIFLEKLLNERFKKVLNKADTLSSI